MKKSLVAAAVTACLTIGTTGAVAGELHETEAPASRAQQTSLDVLLVNDDGWRGEDGSDTPLIAALRAGLEAAGHDVTVVAPGTNQSGQGGRVSLPPTTLSVESPEGGVWTVTPGSPSDSVFFALDAIFPEEDPDLIISGINPGTNLAQAVNHSGTVNGATTGFELGVPSIAVSLEVPYPWRDGVATATPPAVDYITQLVARLQAAADGGPLMPAFTGLNVNIPVAPGPVDPTTGQPGSILPPRGERITRLANYVEYGLDYSSTTGAEGEPGTYRIDFVANESPAEKGTDIHAVRHNFISITPMTADRDVDGRTLGWLRAALR